jgi:hypothetical protein
MLGKRTHTIRMGTTEIHGLATSTVFIRPTELGGSVAIETQKAGNRRTSFVFRMDDLLAGT